VAVEEDELDEAVLEGCSLEHERRRRGDEMEAKNNNGLSSVRGRSKAQWSSGERGQRAVRAGGACHLLMGPREHRVVVVGVVMTSVNGFNSIEGRAR
jgi:hypothetical protein